MKNKIYKNIKKIEYMKIYKVYLFESIWLKIKYIKYLKNKIYKIV